MRHGASSEAGMSWEVNDKEFESVLALSAGLRYEHFIKRSASHGELWGLHGDGRMGHGRG
jgi:hypothetical protein